MAEAESKLFKPIVGCEMYVARRTMDKKEGKPDQSGYHLIVLAKNEKGYHNLIKLVSHAWTRGYYMRPRTDRSELEKYHEGLIVCSACIGGEVPKKIINDQLEEAEEAVRWYKNLFGDDYYLELLFPVPTTKPIRFSRRRMPSCWSLPGNMTLRLSAPMTSTLWMKRMQKRTTA